MKKIGKILLMTMICCVLPWNSYAKKQFNEQVLSTMKTATRFMMDSVSCDGGFVWTYLPDFSRCWGEMEAYRTMAWVQSPGTPGVGNVMLDAYHATGDEYYYQAALKIGKALIKGQLDCGGWNYMFDMAGEESLKQWYATIGCNGWRLEEFQHYYGNATYDDDCTTQVGRYLLRLYVEKQDPDIRKALEKTIDFVLESQYPIGGWPQRYPLMYDHPFHGKADYSSFITYNDNVTPECIGFLTQCYRTLGIKELREPILRAMHVLVLLQQGAPYAGWGDQYDPVELKVMHARSYEPLGVSSGATVSAIRNLMQYYRQTGDRRFLAGIPAALDYLESLRPKGAESNTPDASFSVPRFVDPRNGLPQYIHRVGSNVQNGHYYSDQNPRNTIGHYGSTARVNPSQLRRELDELLAVPSDQLIRDSILLKAPTSSWTQPAALPEYYNVRQPNGFARFDPKEPAERVISELDARGCWLTPLRSITNVYQPYCDTVPSLETRYASTNVGDEHDTSPFNANTGQMSISTNTYMRNMGTLIQYLISQKAK